MKPETTTRACILDRVMKLILSETKRATMAHPAKKIIIFGAGARGIVLHEALKILGHQVAYFIDSNKKKQNSSVCGIPVHEPMKIMYENFDDIFVVLAVAEPKQLIEMLSGFGLDSCTNTRSIFDSHSIGDGTARVKGMPLIDFFLGFTRMSDLPGFKCEDNKENDGSELRIVTLGGSTTDPEVLDPLEWRDMHKRSACTGSWPHILHEHLTSNNIKNCIYNGGFSSYISGQEAFKLIRDVLPLKPDIVINFDGINDAQSYLRYDSSHSKFHSYFKTLEEGFQPFLTKTAISAFGKQVDAPFVKDISYGVAADMSAISEWHANQRIMRSVCNEFGIEYICFLQPGGLFLEEYLQSCDVLLRTHWILWDFFVSQANLIFDFATRDYNSTTKDSGLLDLLTSHLNTKYDHIEEFYRIARKISQNSEYIIDMVSSLNGHPDVFYDNVHCTTPGNKLIAERIYLELKNRGLLEKSLAGINIRRSAT